MNTFSKVLLAFGGGALVGFFAGWQLTKKHYADLAQEEIDSVKEVFSNNFKPKKDESEKKEFVSTVPDKEVYIKLLEDCKYKNQNDIEEEGEAEDLDDEDDIEIITPDNFGEIDYETVYLTYYADSVLATELDDVIQDIGGTIGERSILHFGEYEDDIVHVRNHRLRVDYEVTFDSRSFYEDIKGVSPADE